MTTMALNQVSGENFTLFHGDCIELIRSLPDESVDYSVSSIPFSSLYVYSDSERDLGNCASDEEFFEHFSYLVADLYRVIKPGRLVTVHVMNLPSTKQHNGYIGIRDFRGDTIRAFIDDEAKDIHKCLSRLRKRLWECEEGSRRHDDLSGAIADIERELQEHPAQPNKFIYHSEVCIWKDPVVAMQRTKAIGLLHKQLCKDSTMSRMGIPDYMLTFRKPGENADPVSGGFTYYAGDVESFNSRENKGNESIDIWQRYASPVWDDINQTNTLNVKMGRDQNDDRHVCPLQLDAIERCLQLWTNPGDVVLSPFAGIGSEGVVSLKMGRKFIGFELKESYFNAATNFLFEEEQKVKENSLF